LLSISVIERVHGESTQSILTFDNQSGEPALVKVVGPSPRSVNVASGGTSSVGVKPGRYFIKVRYGRRGRYRYAKGEPFTVRETATQRQHATITLHKVVGGNYRSQDISAEEFGGQERSPAASVATPPTSAGRPAAAPPVVGPRITAPTMPAPSLFPPAEAAPRTYKPAARQGRPIQLHKQGHDVPPAWRLPVTKWVGMADLSPDHRHAVLLWATDREEDIPILWDVETGRRDAAFNAPPESGMCGVFSPDGKQILLGSRRMLKERDDPSAWLVDARTGQVVRKFVGHKRSVHAVAFAPDGKLVATGSWDGGLCLWTTSTGERTAKYDLGSMINHIEFSSDGKCILAALGDLVYLFDIGSGQGFALEHTFPVFAAHFSHDARRVVTSTFKHSIPRPDEPSDARAVRVWDADTGELLWLRRFEDPFSPGFSSDDSRVLVLDNGIFRFLNAESGEEERAAVVGTERSTSAMELRLSSDAEYVMGWRPHSPVTIWKCEDLLRHADQK
jgi:hypothetical protein